MSHELRTPMNAILGFTDALLAGVDGPMNDEQRASLGWVRQGGRDLLGLINDILDLSKIEAGRVVITPEPFSPKALVEAVCGQHRPLAEQKGIRFSWEADDAPAEVLHDSQRVRQILVNLIGNALKFTTAGEVAVTVTGDTDKQFEVVVRDTGPGIQHQDHERIFEEFRRAGAAAATAGGTGLGLAISRRLARMMGGDITLQSALGQGSTFRLRLPLEFPGSSAVRGQLEQPGERTILALDDDPSVPPLIEKMLAGSNYRIVGTTDRAEAMRLARQVHPDVILLDLLMPELDGWQILRDLREDPATRTIPVVVITVVEKTGAAREAEVAAYITKPFDRDRLLRALEGLEPSVTAKR